MQTNISNKGEKMKYGETFHIETPGGVVAMTKDNPRYRHYYHVYYGNPANLKKTELSNVERIRLWLKDKKVDKLRYMLNPTGIEFTFLVGEQKALFLSYVKRLYGEHVFYSYSSKDRIAKYLFKGFSVTIRNF